MQKRQKIHWTILILALWSLHSSGQHSKKESINRYQKIASLTIAEIKTRSYSDLARELSLEDFLAFYIENGKERLSKKYGRETIDSVYRDSTYLYFVHQAQSYPFDLIKVLSKDINDIDIAGIDGNLLRKRFLEEIVPGEDKQRVKRKSQQCATGTENADFDYLYDRNKREVEIKYKWKVTCDFFKVINKTYTSKYNIDNKTFSN